MVRTINKSWGSVFEGEFKESLRIKEENVRLNIVVISGKDGDFFVCISPSAGISGYGKTQKEAEKSFEENSVVFIQDLLAVKKKERKAFLASLGWKQTRYETKNFSKAFVDSDGLLQGLENPTMEVKPLELAM